MKILIIKLGALGDVLRTTFVARGLKEKYGLQSQITWLTKQNAASLLLNNPYVDKIVTWEQRDVLLKEEYDLAIALDDEEEVCAFAAQWKEKTKRFQGAYQDNNGKRRYTKDVEQWFGMGILRPEEEGGKEKADVLKTANRKTFQEIYAKMFDINGTETKPLLFLTGEELQWEQEYFKQHHIPEKNKIIGINSGAGARWMLKMISKEKIAVVCRELVKNKKNTLLLLGGIDEEERNKAIKGMCPEENILFIKPTEDIRKFASMINRCDLLVTTDSLALHVGLALDKKTLAYFGPTSPWEIEMFGRGKKIYKESDCLCCYKKTTETNPSCIDRLMPEDIINPAEEMLAEILKRKTRSINSLWATEGCE